MPIFLKVTKAIGPEPRETVYVNVLLVSRIGKGHDEKSAKVWMQGDGDQASYVADEGIEQLRERLNREYDSPVATIANTLFRALRK
jgi:hypothetical protein